MAGLLSGILGGALQGLGEGMVKQAEQTGLEKREARLAELQHGYRLDEMRVTNDYQTARDNRQNQFQIEGDDRRFAQQKTLAGITNGYQSARDAANREFERQKLGIQHQNDLDKIRVQTEAKAAAVAGLRSGTAGLSADDKRQYDALAGTYGDDVDGLRKALASSGNPRLAGLVSGGAPSSGPPRAEMSTDDVRVWNSVVPFFTDKITGATDTKGLQQHFLDLKRPDLAAIAAGNMSGTGMSRKEAWERAREEAEKRSGPLTSNKTAYPETDGDRDAWTGRRAEELYSGGPGRAVGQGAPAPVTPPPSQAGTPSSRPPPAAPRDPTQRKVGQVYTAPNGGVGEWTGNGWRMR